MKKNHHKTTNKQHCGNGELKQHRAQALELQEKVQDQSGSICFAPAYQSLDMAFLTVKHPLKSRVQQAN